MKPRLCVGAPVGDDREWVLGAWAEALSRQTVQPDYVALVTGETLPDWVRAAVSVLGPYPLIAPSGLPCYTRAQRTASPHDPNRAIHFSSLRNQLRWLVIRTDADLFFSLDSDILLNDPTTIEQLVQSLAEHHLDVVQPTVHLHPSVEAGCINAGVWRSGDLGSMQRAWERLALPPDELITQVPAIIDIPMAAVMMRREVVAKCVYKPHDQGEDVGFADSIEEHGFRVGWRMDLKTDHMWGPTYMKKAADAPV